MKKLIHNKILWLVVALVLLAAIVAVCLTTCGGPAEGQGEPVEVDEMVDENLVIKDENQVNVDEENGIGFADGGPEMETSGEFGDFF